MRRICKRVGCCLFALWLAALAPLAVSAQSLEEIQAQQEQLQAENQQLQTQLDSLREDQAQKQAYLETLQEQISLVQANPHHPGEHPGFKREHRPAHLKAGSLPGRGAGHHRPV